MSLRKETCTDYFLQWGTYLIKSAYAGPALFVGGTVSSEKRMKLNENVHLN